MGTYFEVQLKNTSEKNIKGINEELKQLGYIGETYNGIYYGAFNTLETLKEDVRFMNNDPEGLKQAPDFKRPITLKLLQSLAFWKKIGFCQYKLSGGIEEHPEEVHNLHIIAKYIQANPEVINTKKSSNYDMQTVMYYIEDHLQPEPETQLEMFSAQTQNYL